MALFRCGMNGNGTGSGGNPIPDGQLYISGYATMGRQGQSNPRNFPFTNHVVSFPFSGNHTLVTGIKSDATDAPGQVQAVITSITNNTVTAAEFEKTLKENGADKSLIDLVKTNADEINTGKPFTIPVDTK